MKAKGSFTAAAALLALPLAVGGFYKLAGWVRSTPVQEMDASCSLVEGPCEASFVDGPVRLGVRPNKAEATGLLRFHVEAPPWTQPQLIEITGADMNMGLFRVALQPTDSPGSWALEAALPSCTRHDMRWRLDVILSDRVATFYLDQPRSPSAGGYRR